MVLTFLIVFSLYITPPFFLRQKEKIYNLQCFMCFFYNNIIFKKCTLRVRFSSYEIFIKAKAVFALLLTDI